MRAEDKYKNKKANSPDKEKAKLKAEQNKIKQEKELTEQEKLQKKIRNIVETIFPHFESFRMTEDGFHFSTENCEITFNQLQELSVIFSTTYINLDRDEKVSEGCSTCGWGEKYLRPIYVGKVNFDKFKG